MVLGVEIDMVVQDSLAAVQFYGQIFNIEQVEATAFEKGNNEAVFTIFGARFHLLDENPQFQLFAPKPGDPKPVWFNVVVPDIEITFEKAVNVGCSVVQPVTTIPDLGVSNGLFSDPYGYLWMLHQVHKEVSFADRVKIMENNMRQSNT